MRNLRCVRSTRRDLPSDDYLPITATAWDSSSDALICTLGPCESSAVIELRRVNDNGHENVSSADAYSLIASWDAPCPLPDLDCDKVLNLQYFSDTATACLVLAGGDIVIVREEPLPGEDLIEIVGSVDAGITAAAWSPDEELLAITTRADTLLYMTRDFENVTNVTFTPDDFKVSNHVSVGWGKKETQFQGKRAKALRDPTIPEKVDQGLLSPRDDGRVSITWRGDGAYLAINTVEEEKRRMIRVYSRDGVLDSVSEPVDYLEGALSWRPAGNLIAGIQRKEEAVDVVFFERNGLRHGEFSLSAKPEDNIGLAWNSDSTVLAVSFKNRLQLWTMGNYHYYLKEDLYVDGLSYEPRWHPEKALRLAIASPSTRNGVGAGFSMSSEYTFCVDGGSVAQPNDYGTVAVIDGSTLRVTPLRSANVPPPMSLHEVDVGRTPVDVAINSSSTRLAVLRENDVQVYGYDPTSKFPSDPQHIPGREDFGATVAGRYSVRPRQVAFRGESELFVLFDFNKEEDGGHVILHKSLEEDDYTELRLPSAPAHSLVPSVDYSKICILHRDGTVSAVSPDRTECQTICKIPARPALLEVVTHGEEDIAFGLTSSGMLYANGRLLVKNCTSFRVTPAHLVFTTTQHLLKFVHLATVQDLEVPPDEPEKDERVRAIERGARLISVMPSSYAVVLQMPRGNLETIYPRALVVAGIRKSINEKRYKTAFMACRSQRVDMNILHDHAPEQFMSNVQLFIDQLKKVGHVDLFLSQLRNEDVTQTMYKETAKKSGVDLLTNGESSGTARFEIPTKVNRICDAFLAVLQSRTATNLQNIVTANVCKSPPDLEGGLQVVAKLKEQDDSLAEKAAEHICFLADVNQLYDTALGLYNLEVALLIAQQSQKDPREYLPYLQGLQTMEPLRRQFTIDDNLGRRTKALTHLHEMDAFDEVKAYVEKHELYSEAIGLYKYQEERLCEIMKLHAQFLSSRNRFREAGIAFEYLSDFSAATEAYRAANMWREALSCATFVPLAHEELIDLATALADTLAETKDFAAAATVHLEYLDDLEGATRLFCKGYHFAEAMRIVGLKGRRELVEAVIDPGLVEGSAAMTELLAECKGQLNAQVPRLRELRVKKREDPLAFFTGDPSASANADGADIPDNVSVAPSTTSTSGMTFLTRYTGHSQSTLATNTTRRSSKNRRREERKRARGKKGSVYEEEYLVNSIARLIERVNAVADDVARLVQGLVRRHMRGRAEAVQRGIREVVELARACVAEVFEVEGAAAATAAAAAANGGGVGGAEEGELGAEGGVLEGLGARPGGADGVVWDAIVAERRRKEVPVVKGWEDLGLVG
ncbi:IKI3 family-domain-containing protein [Phyllosticta paracitricarpa]|uniref:Elongator complex protein 1 n=1 Tax=Phyllosticta paracitricarpa TaxID=2016321 RepID=A0ABR1NC48_9PEZI